MVDDVTEEYRMSCRYDVLGEFMEYIARNPVLGDVPAVFVAYLGILSSLASGPKGAQVICSRNCLLAMLVTFRRRLAWQRVLNTSAVHAGHVPAAEGG